MNFFYLFSIEPIYTRVETISRLNKKRTMRKVERRHNEYALKDIDV